MADPRFEMGDPGLVPDRPDDEMYSSTGGGVAPPEPDMGGNPNAEPFDPGMDAPMDDGTMGTGTSSPVVQMIEEGLAMLSPQEIQILDQAITPQLAPILGKMLGPEVEAMIQPFAQPSPMDQPMGGAGEGPPAMTQPAGQTTGASTGRDPATGTMPQHGMVGLDGGSVPGGALAGVRA